MRSEQLPAVRHHTETPNTHTSAPKIFDLSRTSSPGYTSPGLGTKAGASAGPFVVTGHSYRVRFANTIIPRTLPNQLVSHRQEQCPVVADGSVRAKVLEARKLTVVQNES